MGRQCNKCDYANTSMWKTKFTVILIGIMANNFALAQAFKCKKADGQFVIQDSPCKADRLSEPSSSLEDQLAKERGMELCKSEAPSKVSWKDPSSVIVGSVIPGLLTETEINGRRVRTRYFTVMTNAKNSYGAYTGEKRLGCYTSLDGNKIVKVSTLLFDSKF